MRRAAPTATCCTSISCCAPSGRAAAGVNAGSLYHFFPGKQDVLLAVLATYRDNITAMLLEPAWRGVADPIEKVFALLGRYRDLVDTTDCAYGCPIGSLALELAEPDPSVRELLAANLTGWTDAVRRCFEAAGERLPASTDRAALAEFVLTTMEGAVMQARTHRDVGYFDRAAAELRRYIGLLEAAARPRGPKPRRRAATSSRSSGPRRAR
jgi:TetR/AcrR family transcriptional regulator, transcriptional repressor for nem operon